MNIAHMKHISLFIGRFQPFHYGHLAALERIQSEMLGRWPTEYHRNELAIVVAVGYSGEIDDRHIFHSEDVKEMVSAATSHFRVPVLVVRAQDTNDINTYGHKVLSSLNDVFTGTIFQKPTLTVYSGNDHTLDAFRRKISPDNFIMDLRVLEKKQGPFLCGTQIRSIIMAEILGYPSETPWRKYVPPQVIPFVDSWIDATRKELKVK